MRSLRVFINGLIDGEVPPASPAELGALLHWLVGRRKEAAIPIERAFNARGIPAAVVRQFTLTYLDCNRFRRHEDRCRFFGPTPRLQHSMRLSIQMPPAQRACTRLIRPKSREAIKLFSISTNKQVRNRGELDLVGDNSMENGWLQMFS